MDCAVITLFIRFIVSYHLDQNSFVHDTSYWIYTSTVVICSFLLDITDGDILDYHQLTNVFRLGCCCCCFEDL